ncbi:hypothetical protein [Microbacterium hydrocarbonoxydans]|uniref:hypothetical protein n=1 Tax=Microbacterium hydrocarbonoxydans TaxID=273678 RepID=UPI00203BB559|nr:hypothetical protein [Microbacterium hydrocarbonoxydans]MCM3779860.1 hypothetical protein [Microbacterium hydrocarbonoxydans]
MTDSSHVYTVALKGSPNVQLSKRTGSVSLDARRRPHVQGTVVIAVPSLTVLAALDPRTSPPPRILIDVLATFPWGVQHRVFDLTLRDRSVDLAEATVTLTLASDEALLSDYAPLADDTAPLNYQSSLRLLVGYVLGKVIPGTVLSPGGIDVTVPALANSSNLIRNPRAGTNTTDWAWTQTSGGLTPTRRTTGGPAYSPTYVAYVSNAGVFTNNAEIYIGESAVSLSGGKHHVLSVDLSGATGRQIILDAVCFDASGNILGFIPPVTTTMTAGTWKRAVTAPFAAYANTAKIRVRVRANQLGGSEEVDVTAWRLSEATGDLVADGLYFDGSTTDTTQYDYEWANTAHASVSTRRVKINAATPDALIWKAGQDALTFLAPLVQAAGRRLVCDEQRVWTLRDENYDAGGALEIRHAVNMAAGSEKTSRDDDDWFDAAAVEYEWKDQSGTTQQLVETASLTPSYTRLRRFQLATPYPGPGRAAYVVRRAQGRGREVTVSTVADWSAKAEQGITVVLEGSPTQIGQTNVVQFDLDSDQMTITSRTIDTPTGAIDLLAGTIDSLVGTIDAL